jgi:hypothetical protein
LTAQNFHAKILYTKKSITPKNILHQNLADKKLTFFTCVLAPISRIQFIQLLGQFRSPFQHFNRPNHLEFVTRLPNLNLTLVSQQIDEKKLLYAILIVACGERF